jgi:hypothetical protein
MHRKCEVIANGLQLAQRPDWHEQLSSRHAKGRRANQRAAGVYRDREPSEADSMPSIVCVFYKLEISRMPEGYRINA